MATIRLLFAYPTSNASGGTSATDTFDRVINEANQIYARSGVNQTLSRVGTVPLDLTQKPQTDQEIYLTLVNTAGDVGAAADQPSNPNNPIPSVRQIATERKRVFADAVVYWSAATGASGARGIGVNPHDAYMYITKDSLDGPTLAHELGHLQGLWHTDGMVYPYQADGRGFYTIMASNIPGTRNRSSIPYFSNPNVNYNGWQTNWTDVPTGVAYVWNEAAQLNAVTDRFAQYGNRLNEPYSKPNNLGTITDVDLGDRGEMWAVDDQGVPWQWVAVDWVPRPLPPQNEAVQIAVGSPLNVWCRDRNYRLWRWADGAWSKPDAGAWGAHISATGDRFAMHAGTSGYSWQTSDGLNWGGQTFAAAPAKVAIVNANRAWRLTQDGRLGRFDGSAWQDVDPNGVLTPVRDLSAGSDGTIMLIDARGQIMRSFDDGQTWSTMIPILPVTDPVYAVTGTPTMIRVNDMVRALQYTSAGKLYRKVTTAADWLPIDWKSAAGSDSS